MITKSFRSLLLIGVILALPGAAHAQEATITGTVSDSTGGVLPGVTVTATNEASGNTFEAVTDALGQFRMPVRIGVYRMSAELAGFATQLLSGVTVLVGQSAAVSFQMRLSNLQESVTVTGETPLIDTVQSKVGGNINARQVSELPVNGRNWLDLAMLAPGVRANAVSNTPLPTGIGGAFQINLDGQEMTQSATTQGNYDQSGLSRDAIAEFEFIANRFDATQGRSTGIIINAVTKSGTNTATGTFAGYFRDDRFNAADFIQKRVLPYSDQQWSVTYGGPIRRDRIHFFVNYEFEREPKTFTFSSPYAAFNIDLSSVRKEHKGGGRLDMQLSPRLSLYVRANTWASLQPINPRESGGASYHPSSSTKFNQFDTSVFVGVSQILSNRTVNQIKGGYNNWRVDPANNVEMGNYPTIFLRGGYQIGPGTANNTTPFIIQTPRYSVRDDLTHSYTMAGRHDLKAGGEYTRLVQDTDWCFLCRGTLDATGGAVPANIQELFPVWDDPTTWNYAALSPITVRYRRAVGDFHFKVPKHLGSAWVQDDWSITSRLTLNLGVRYEIQTNPYANSSAIPPFVPVRPTDKDNVAPRLGMAYSLTDRTVLRGGWGLYFGEVLGQSGIFTQASSIQIVPETPNDQRPDFAANPFNVPGGFNGTLPTYEAVLARTCAVSRVPGCVRRDFQNISMNTDLPFSHQATAGVQRQLGNTMSLTADYAYVHSRGLGDVRNANLTFNPATGTNYPFSDISRRPFPDFGLIAITSQQGPEYDGYTTSHALQTGFTKQFSSRWQASATYTLAGLWSATGLPMQASSDGTKVIFTPLPFEAARDLGGERTLAADDQRHRAVLNGIWELPYQVQLSGLYFYGSGMRFFTSYGADLRGLGVAPSAAGSEGRLRPDGSILPRNNFVGRPLHRVDMRLQKRFTLGPRFAIDGLVEAFNLLNHENYGNYVTAETSPSYGRPSAVINTAYQPRTMQFGFRATF